MADARADGCAAIMGAMADKVDALVIFGATGDLAKLETFPALVGLVKRGVLNVPVVGVAKSGWGLEQFRDYAVASLKLNGMDPADPAAVTMLGLLRYVDGDLGDEATYQAMYEQIGRAEKILYYMVPEDLLTFRVWPETAVRLTVHGKKPGAGYEAQPQQLSFSQQPGTDIRPYDLLIGAALDGDRWLFARQDTVESAWEIVDPVLGDAVPVHPYAQGSWGPAAAAGLLGDG